MPNTSFPARPVLPKNGTELYDSIMSKIEPELVSSEIPLLEQKYGFETEGLKRVRLDRYRDAFQKYDEAYQVYLAQLRQQIKQYKVDAFAWAEAEATINEDTQMKNIDAAINTPSQA